jgi:DNA polymerase-3 subunit delta'
MMAGMVGHTRQLSLLRGGIERDAVGSSYLFLGPPGVGKSTAARYFAGALLCQSWDGDPCGQCASCRCAVAAHPDLQLVTPEKGKKILKISQVREAQELLALTPSLGSRKVAVFDPADAMNLEAANAMLKTLEEPPEGTVIILVASNPGVLPATVLSRCRKVSFGHLSEDEVREVLLREGWSEEEAAAAAGVSEGSPGLALSLESDTWRKALTLLEAFLKAPDRGAVFEEVEGRTQDRAEAESLVRILAGRVRRELRFRLGLEGSGAGSGLEGIDTARLVQLGGDLMETARLLDGNVNVKLAMGALFSPWAEFFVPGAGTSGAAKGKKNRR